MKRARRDARGDWPRNLQILLALIALPTIATIGWIGRVPRAVPLLYLGMSLLAFATYALDKRGARQGAQRIPEDVLHLLAFACGWPGALIAQQTLRHKTAKTSFRIVFWLTLLANIAGLGWLLTPSGQHLRFAT